MFVRIIKTAIVAALTVYGARKATSHIKLVATRKAAKDEMDRIEGLMKEIFEDTTLTREECGKRFDVYLDQHKRFSKVYSKTL